MEVYILDPVVRQNVRLLMHIVQDALKQSEGNIKRVERVYSLVINRKTGEFQEVNDRRLAGDWKKIIIKIPGHLQAGCEVLDPFKPDTFVFSDLQHSAWISLLKTVHIMDQLVYPDRGDKDPVISLIHCVIDTEKETKSFPLLLLNAWHPVSREEAERLLEQCPVKTFLFRQDEYAKILERELNDQHGMHLKCFTLTYKGSNGKITDRTLIEHKGLWSIYQDDPSRALEHRSSFEEALSSLKDELGKPLYN